MGGWEGEGVRWGGGETGGIIVTGESHSDLLLGGRWGEGVRWRGGVRWGRGVRWGGVGVGSGVH